MFNAMKIGCPECNPKGYKTERKVRYTACKFCFGTHYVDWIELAQGGKQFKYSGSSSCSSGSITSSSKSSPSSHIKPIRRKNDYVQDQKKFSRSHWTPFIKT